MPAYVYRLVEVLPSFASAPRVSRVSITGTLLLILRLMEQRKLLLG